MNILVLLSGIVDAKWALPSTVDAASLAAHRASHPLIGPFDEACLELALKLRDADPATHIAAIVGASSDNDALLRQVAGFRLDEVQGFDLARQPARDAGALARSLAGSIGRRARKPDLVLIGREFGDEDDGSVPATLAEVLGLPFCSLVLALEPGEGGLVALRQNDAELERRQLALPAVAAVTNHVGNRLRKPLLKNVMNARKLSFELLPPEAAGAGAPTVTLEAIGPASERRRAARCRMIEGNVAAQADELARLLLAQEQDR